VTLQASFPRVVGVLLLLSLAQSARAYDGVVLERLHRIARGEWLPGTPVAGSVPYAEQLRAAARRHRLPASLLAALVRAESDFDPHAVSRAGAQGLGQLMPQTARELDVSDPFDPVQNLEGAARYLSTQVASFPNLQLALAAYHAGPERASFGLASVPRSTRTYISRVLRFEREYRRRGLP